MRVCNGCVKAELQRARGRGNLEADIVFLGDFPKKIEIVQDKIFSTASGKMLYRVLSNMKKDPLDYYYTNICQCSESITKGTVTNCLAGLREELQAVQPKVIVAMGATAAQVMLHSQARIEELSGRDVWSKTFNAYIIPIVSPGSLFYDPSKMEAVLKGLNKAFGAVSWAPGGKPEHIINPIVPQSGVEALQLLKELQHHNDWQSCDIETDGFDYLKQDILSIGFSPNANDGIIFGKELIEHPEIQKGIIENFRNPNNLFCLQNGKFDRAYMMHPGIPGSYQKKVIIPNARCDFDTMLAHYCIDERQGTHGLKSWAKEYFDAPDWDAALKPYLPNHQTPYSAIPPQILYKYQAFDTCYTYMGRELFAKMMKEEGTEHLFYNILMPAMNALCEIEARGVRIDRPKLLQLEHEMGPKLEEAKKHLDQAAFKVGFTPERYQKETGAREKPKFFNPNSHPQMAYVAYDLCKVPLFGGKKTCNKDAVEVYQYRHPFWKAIADYKQINDLFGIYVKGMLERIDDDEFVRPDFLLHGTVTGRLSCHDPNLQNIPRKSFVKDLFIGNESSGTPEEDTVIVSADYKTLEVVVAAILSGDAEMQKPFLEGKDYHTQTMKRVFGEQVAALNTWAETADFAKFDAYLHTPMMLEIRNAGCDYLYNKPDKDDSATWIKKEPSEVNYAKLADLIIDYLRFLTKFITFGIMYGRKAKSLAEGELNCSVNNAQLYINNFFKMYPDFAAWQARMIHQAKTEGFVQNPFGFKRRWKYLTSDQMWSMRIYYSIYRCENCS